jgi:FtsH-binding integral membrane protein
MFVSLQDFNVITPILLLLTWYSSFKDGKPTCDKYLFNSCLYIMSALCVFITTIHLQRETSFITDDKLMGVTIGGFLLCLLAIWKIRTENTLIKHLLLAYIVIYLGIISVHFYERFDSQLIDETLMRTTILSAVALAITLVFPHILKDSFYTKLIYIFIFLVIAYFIDIFVFKSTHQLIFSYLFVMVFFVFIMYDSKFILQRATSCRKNADYVGGTLDIFLDLINLFQQLLIIGDN